MCGRTHCAQTSMNPADFSSEGLYGAEPVWTGTRHQYFHGTTRYLPSSRETPSWLNPALRSQAPCAGRVPSEQHHKREKKSQHKNKYRGERALRIQCIYSDEAILPQIHKGRFRAVPELERVGSRPVHHLELPPTTAVVRGGSGGTDFDKTRNIEKFRSSKRQNNAKPLVAQLLKWKARGRHRYTTPTTPLPPFQRRTRIWSPAIALCVYAHKLQGVSVELSRGATVVATGVGSLRALTVWTVNLPPPGPYINGGCPSPYPSETTQNKTRRDKRPGPTHD